MNNDSDSFGLVPEQWYTQGISRYLCFIRSGICLLPHQWSWSDLELHSGSCHHQQNHQWQRSDEPVYSGAGIRDVLKVKKRKCQIYTTSDRIGVLSSARIARSWTTSTGSPNIFSRYIFSPEWSRRLASSLKSTRMSMSLTGPASSRITEPKIPIRVRWYVRKGPNNYIYWVGEHRIIMALFDTELFSLSTLVPFLICLTASYRS